MINLLGVRVNGPWPVRQVHIPFAAVTGKPVTALYGRNGAGKSMLLEAVQTGMSALPYRGIAGPGRDDAVGAEYTAPVVFYTEDTGVRTVFTDWQSRPGPGVELTVLNFHRLVELELYGHALVLLEAAKTAGLDEATALTLLGTGLFAIVPDGEGGFVQWLAAPPHHPYVTEHRATSARLDPRFIDPAISALDLASGLEPCSSGQLAPAPAALGLDPPPEWASVPIVALRRVNFTFREPMAGLFRGVVPTPVSEPSGRDWDLDLVERNTAAAAEAWKRSRPVMEEPFWDPSDEPPPRPPVYLISGPSHTGHGLPPPDGYRLTPEGSAFVRMVVGQVNETLDQVLGAQPEWFLALAPGDGQEPFVARWTAIDRHSGHPVEFSRLSRAEQRWSAFALSLVPFQFSWWEAGLEHEGPLPDDAFLIVDEPEASLHREGVRSLGRVLPSLAGTVLCATHAIELLNDEHQLVHVQRDGFGAVVADPISLPGLRSRLDASGLTPGDLASLTRAVLVVEGPHDAACVENWMGSLFENEVVILAYLDNGTHGADMFGTANGVLVTGQAAELLTVYELTDATFVFLTDGSKRKPSLSAVYGEAVRMSEAEGTSAVVEYLSRFGKPAKPRDRTLEAFARILMAAFWRDVAHRCHIIELKEPDIANYLPCAEVSNGAFQQWPHARKEFYRQRSRQTDGKAFKDFINDRGGRYHTDGLREVSSGFSPLDESTAVKPEHVDEWAEAQKTILDLARHGRRPSASTADLTVNDDEDDD